MLRKLGETATITLTIVKDREYECLVRLPNGKQIALSKTTIDSFEWTDPPWKPEVGKLANWHYNGGLSYKEVKILCIHGDKAFVELSGGRACAASIEYLRDPDVA